MASEFTLTKYYDIHAIKSAVESKAIDKEECDKLIKLYRAVKNDKDYSITTKYKQTDETGRYYPKSPFADAYMWRHTRASLSSNELDIDAVNCAYTIFCSLCEQAQLSVDYVRRFVDMRDFFIDDLDITKADIDHHNEVNNDTVDKRSIAKKFFSAILHNGSDQVWKKSLDLTHNPVVKDSEVALLVKEVRSLKQALLSFDKYNDLKKKYKTKALYHIINDVEAKIVTDLIKIFQQNSIQVTSFIYDGFQVRSKDKTRINNILNGYVNQYDLKFIIKDFPLTLDKLTVVNRTDDEVEMGMVKLHSKPEDEIDQAKVLSFVPKTDQLDLNKVKWKAVSELSDLEKEELGRLTAGKYVIRVGEHWHIVNLETGKCVNSRPYSKDKYNHAVGGTVLEKTEYCDNIKLYDRFVFKDPNQVKSNEWNTYSKNLKYDPKDTTPLLPDELAKIEIVLTHFFEQFCRKDDDSYKFLMKILQNKFAKPFDLPSKPVCLVLFGLEGAGKTMPIEKLFGNAFDYEYISPSASFEAVTNPTGFTDKIESKLVVIMNEIPSADYNHKKMYENFKAMVSDKYRNSQIKYQGSGDVKNTILYIATTNNKNAFQLSQTDRRYFMLDVSSSKKGNDEYFSQLAHTLDTHWELIVRYILGFNMEKNLKIPDNAIRKHCKDIGLSFVGQWLKQKFEMEEWEPDDEGYVLSSYHAEYKVYMENEHSKKGLILSKFKGEMTGMFYFKYERKCGESVKKMYIEDLAELKKAVGVEID